MNGRYSRTPILLIIGLLITALPMFAVAAEPITTGSLVEEMIDLPRLANFPDPAYKTVQFSSYDRRSKYPDGPDWFANSDGFGNEPIPNFEAILKEPGDDNVGEYLVCDVAGPGAIVRTWTAAIAGDIRLFLDEADEPIYEGSAQEFFLRSYDKLAEDVGLDSKLFKGTFYQRNAAYCPIPFAKRCRIVWRGSVKKVHFYEVQLRQYAPGAKVTTFQPQDLKTYESQIKKTANVLADPQAHWPYASSHTPLPIDVTIAADKSETILTVDGPKALERLTLQVSAEDLEKALRQAILRINCDGYLWGQVQTPIGDFFGAAPGVNPFNSVPLTVQPDGTMTTRYIMPFAKSLKISIDNTGDQPITVTGSVLPMDYTWNNKTSMHFRARWRVDHNLFNANKRTHQDMPYLIANGMGVYVGTATFLLNPNNIASPGGNWWGEGDEKIFVDDDVRPSTFGTGSEDYFNYAWGAGDIFGYPYCGQPRCDGPVTRGFITNQRWHILDALPFKQRLSFYMELYPHEPTPGTSYARIAYHYGRPGLMDDHVAITTEDVRHLELPSNWKPAARRGAAGAVFYEAEELRDGDPAIRFIEDNLWSGGKLMVWHPANKGDELRFQLPIPEEGKYEVVLATARTPDSASVSGTLDGKPFLQNKNNVVNLHVPYRILSILAPGTTSMLTKGDHTLVVRYEDHPDNVTQPMVGIDFIMVQKKKR